MAIQDSYPLGTPSVSGNNITVPMLLNEPTRITRYLSDLSLKDLWAADVFSTGGSVSGGALVYDQLTLNDIALDAGRSVQNVEPGAEFPIVTHSVGTPSTALVEKFGGKFWFTDEARDRNDLSLLERKARKLLNDIIVGVNSRALTLLDASITAFTATQTVTGTSWATATTTASGSRTAAVDPMADFAEVDRVARVQGLGYDIDTWIINPNESKRLRLLYGAGNVTSILSDNGISNLIVSNLVAAGTAYAIASGQVGDLRLEKGLSTESWREPETQRTWVQSDIRPVMAVTDPYAAFKVTGLAA